MNRHQPGAGGDSVTSPQLMVHHNNSSQSQIQQPQGTSSTTLTNDPNPPPITRIFIQRDYRHGTEVRFLADYPPELIGRIEQRDFEVTMKYINSIFDDAEAFDCAAFCESVLSCLTVNILYLIKDTRYEKCLKKIAEYVQDQNHLVYLPRGVQVVDPLERGLRCIEIRIYNNEQMRS